MGDYDGDYMEFDDGMPWYDTIFYSVIAYLIYRVMILNA